MLLVNAVHVGAEQPVARVALVERAANAKVLVAKREQRLGNLTPLGVEPVLDELPRVGRQITVRNLGHPVSPFELVLRGTCEKVRGNRAPSRLGTRSDGASSTTPAPPGCAREREDC